MVCRNPVFIINTVLPHLYDIVLMPCQGNGPFGKARPTLALAHGEILATDTLNNFMTSLTDINWCFMDSCSRGRLFSRGRGTRRTSHLLLCLTHKSWPSFTFTFVHLISPDEFSSEQTSNLFQSSCHDSTFQIRCHLHSKFVLAPEGIAGFFHCQKVQSLPSSC